MKDKLIAFSTLGLVFGLFFYYKVVSPVDTIADNNNLIEDIVVIENPIEQSINEDITISVEDVNLNKDSECNLSEDETNVLDFSSAFKYYRVCNNPGENFTWKGNLYSTLLKVEVKDENNIVDNTSINNKSVDKDHLKLQNQLIGMDVK
tara:strand:- start:380 stop:826 length:447 start_codon:yes stop_codon:yes gene_type:complete